MKAPGSWTAPARRGSPDPAANPTAGLPRSTLRETFGQIKCGVGRPAHSKYPMDSVKSYIRSHRQQFEGDLADLLRIASVSADSRQNGETKRASEWVAAQLRGSGLATELIPTE